MKAKTVKRKGSNFKKQLQDMSAEINKLTQEASELSHKKTQVQNTLKDLYLAEVQVESKIKSIKTLMNTIKNDFCQHD